jgi:hypothetical protein
VSECLSTECLTEASEALARVRGVLANRHEAMTAALWAATEAINAAETLLLSEQSSVPEYRREQLILAINFARSAVVASRYAAGER